MESFLISRLSYRVFLEIAGKENTILTSSLK